MAGGGRGGRGGCGGGGALRPAKGGGHCAGSSPGGRAGPGGRELPGGRGAGGTLGRGAGPARGRVPSGERTTGLEKRSSASDRHRDFPAPSARPTRGRRPAGTLGCSRPAAPAVSGREWPGDLGPGPSLSAGDSLGTTVARLAGLGGVPEGTWKALGPAELGDAARESPATVLGWPHPGARRADRRGLSTPGALPSSAIPAARSAAVLRAQPGPRASTILCLDPPYKGALPTSTDLRSSDFCVYRTSRLSSSGFTTFQVFEPHVTRGHRI
ncbi:uncharacterized protein WM277_012411 [Molossus nigricans]